MSSAPSRAQRVHRPFGKCTGKGVPHSAQHLVSGICFLFSRELPVQKPNLVGGEVARLIHFLCKTERSQSLLTSSPTFERAARAPQAGRVQRPSTIPAVTDP